MKVNSPSFSFLSALFLFFLPLSPFPQAQQQSDETQLWVKDQEGNRIELYRDSYALLIGVDRYTAGWPNLPEVAKDIEDVGKILAKQGFRVEVVRNPTKEKILTSIEDFSSKYGSEPDNRLLFYFAGHGHTARLATGIEIGYIVPADAPNPNVNEQGFKARGIDMQQFENYAQRIECKHVLFMFDSCFSGSIFALSRGAVPDVISYKTARPVRQFITSGSADELVPDKSIFKSEFLNGIMGDADTNSDGYVTGTELGEYLLTKVVSYSKGSQHPQYGKIRNPLLDKGDFVFIVNKVTVATTKQKPADSYPEVELEFWKSVRESNTEQAYEAYLKKFPTGVFVELARQKVDEIRVLAKNATTAKKAEATLVQTEPLRPLEKEEIVKGESRQVQISIKTNRPALVYIDGERVGEVPPVHTRSITVGTHLIELESTVLGKKLPISIEAAANKNIELRVFIDSGTHKVILSDIK